MAIALLLIAQVFIIDRTALPAAQKDSVTWDAIFAWIQRDWPEVPQMSTRELAQRMAANSGATPVLIDVRTHEKYEVSHLPGAIWAETPSQIACAVRAASDQKPVALYCSVDVRSSRAAAKLMESGRDNVFNLQGSIFQWANEGRAVAFGLTAMPATGCSSTGQGFQSRLMRPASTTQHLAESEDNGG